MESFRIRLEACDPERRCFRAYCIEAGTDLLGHWLVDVTYGRIGSRGRLVRHVAGDEAEEPVRVFEAKSHKCMPEKNLRCLSLVKVVPLLARTYGSQRRILGQTSEARKIVRHCLQRRATAPRRIGVAYQTPELKDTGQWVPGGRV